MCVLFHLFSDCSLAMWSLLKSNISRTLALSKSNWSRFNSTNGKILRNEAIKFPEMRVIIKDAETNKNTWKILSRAEALSMAKKQKLDLVLVSATSTPPVCKLENYQKLVQLEKEKEKKTRMSLKARTTKEVLVKVGIDPHDLRIKMNRARKFLLDGHPVKVSIFFHRRAMYKTQRHIEKNATSSSTLPLVDIEEIYLAIFGALQDIPTTVVKKEVNGEEEKPAAAPIAAADGEAESVDDFAEMDSGDDDKEDGDDDIDDDASDTDSVVSAFSDTSDISISSEPAIQKTDMPKISKFHMRREVTFFPKTAAIAQMKLSKTVPSKK